MEFRKSEKSNLENKRMVFFLVGMLTVMGLTYASFNVKTFIDSTYDFELSVEEDLVDLPPVTTPPPPPPPPPPPAKPPVEPELEIVEDEIEIPEPDFQEDFDDIEIEDETSFEEERDEEIDDVPMTFVANMPHFKDCEGLKSNLERDQCTRKLFNSKINACYQVPDIDREMGVNATIAVQFTINRDGEVAFVQVLQGINDRLDKEAMRCVNKFPKMIPGKNLDKPVSINYTIPIRVNVQ